MAKQLKSPLRYPGGKFRARKILEEFVPANVKSVVSPFFGGGSFELHLNNKGIQVRGHDKFWLLTNFWEQLLQDRITLSSIIEPYLGCITKDTFKLWQNELSLIETAEEKPESGLLEIAMKFFIVNRCSFSGATLSGGFSKYSAEDRFTLSSVESIRNFENPNLQVSYADFEYVLCNEVEKDDFLFLDPPYKLNQASNKLYGVKGSMHKAFDHEKLFEIVSSGNNRFLLTYNDSEEIRDIWSNYKIIDTAWSYGMNTSRQSSELIITNCE